ncbi:MAG TPA: hypothetical protein VHL78_07965 [Actinomycetota bacterium]|nr:hypothetical protein [Actinomycetota bacterium]
MGKWVLAGGLGVMAHFAASYLVPLEEKDQGALGGLLRFAWPWSVGDTGLLGRIDGGSMPIVGFWIAMAAAVLAGMAALAVLGVWVPTGWWRGLAVGGALAEVALMTGFFGPTKLLPIVASFGAIAVATGVWQVFETA